MKIRRPSEVKILLNTENKFLPMPWNTEIITLSNLLLDFICRLNKEAISQNRD